jgi:hypothetical protein
VTAPPTEGYYGRPIVKPPVWKEEIGWYLFTGGLAGASSTLALGARIAGNDRLARSSTLLATAGLAVSPALLIKDLGRPERFLNMLRMIKPSSPMSVGTWVITAFGGAAGAAAASAVTGRLPRAGAVATAGTTVLGPVVCTYTAALLCDTAVPAWHDAHREMPYLFAGSAAAAAGGLGMLAGPAGEAGPAVRFALLGAATEITAKSLLLRRLGDIAEPYQHGRPGWLMELAEILTSAGLAGAVLGGHSRVATRLAGAALLASSALTRLGIFEAGQGIRRRPEVHHRPAARAPQPQARRAAASRRHLAAAGGCGWLPAGGCSRSSWMWLSMSCSGRRSWIRAYIR